MSRARYVMIGGFLGAGKTTAVARLGRRLTDEGMRVGLITNDQGSGLVDTRSLRSQGFQVEEIAGGCFCCRFDSLARAAVSLTAATRPDVFIAEPVGSCTDLVATVSYPLSRIYGDAFTITPLSVMVDPVRALRVLGLAPGPRFSDKVLYVYGKQLEEADAIVINKCDLVAGPDREALERALAGRYPDARRFVVSARDGTGLSAWFDWVMREELSPRAPLAIDYDRYAEGEARLGWLNATIRLASGHELDASELLTGLAEDLGRRMASGGAEVAHLKMTLEPDGGTGDIALVSLVRQDLVPELALALAAPVQAGRITLNLRAEADPVALREAVEDGLARCARSNGIALDVDHLESFRPARPVPTHRARERSARERSERPSGSDVESPRPAGPSSPLPAAPPGGPGDAFGDAPGRP
jgi:Ni2+-binding GTPase involved in maturation of urease and hydrogenase